MFQSTVTGRLPWVTGRLPLVTAPTDTERLKDVSDQQIINNRRWLTVTFVSRKLHSGYFRLCEVSSNTSYTSRHSLQNKSTVSLQSWLTTRSSSSGCVPGNSTTQTWRQSVVSYYETQQTTESRRGHYSSQFQVLRVCWYSFISQSAFVNAAPCTCTGMPVDLKVASVRLFRPWNVKK